MTAVRIVDAAKYGARIVAYVFVVSAVGLGALAVGYALAWDQLGGLFDAGTGQIVQFVAGGLAALIGLFLVSVAVVSGLYKLLADGIAAGSQRESRPPGTRPGGDVQPPAETSSDTRSAADSPATISGPVAEETDEATDDETPNGDAVEEWFGDGQTDSGDAAEDDLSQTAEPSPEEIVFGDEAPSESASTDEVAVADDPGSDESDPLGDFTEET